MRRWSRVAAFSLVCTAMALPAMAQDTLSLAPAEAEPVEQPGLTGFGIIGGLSFSKLSLGGGITLDNAKNRTAFVGGAFFTLGLGNILAIQPEVLLSMKGTKASNPTQNFTTGDLTLSMDYIEIPLLLKAYIPINNPNLRPNLFAGPAIAFLINSRVGEDVISGTRDCANGGPTIKDTDTSFMFGAGLDFMQNFTAQVRFDMGLDDVVEEEGTAKNRSLMLMLGYFFAI
jgi:hypothetical protein